MKGYFAFQCDDLDGGFLCFWGWEGEVHKLPTFVHGVGLSYSCLQLYLGYFGCVLGFPFDGHTYGVLGDFIGIDGDVVGPFGNLVILDDDVVVYAGLHPPFLDIVEVGVFLIPGENDSDISIDDCDEEIYLFDGLGLVEGEGIVVILFPWDVVTDDDALLQLLADGSFIHCDGCIGAIELIWTQNNNLELTAVPYFHCSEPFLLELSALFHIIRPEYFEGVLIDAGGDLDRTEIILSLKGEDGFLLRYQAFQVMIFLNRFAHPDTDFNVAGNNFCGDFIADDLLILPIV